MVAFDVAGFLALIASLALGIPAFRRAGRAERRAKSAEERAENAERRADRIEARETERHDADWEFSFREDDLTILEVSNTGSDDAYRVLVVAEIDGHRVYEDAEVIRGRRVDTMALSFPFIEDELKRAARQSMEWVGNTSIPLTVLVSIRVRWSTALGAPKSQESEPMQMELRAS